MNICIGGDLAGQVVEFDKRRFEAKEVEEGKTSSYRKQSYVFGESRFNFWLSEDLDFSDASNQALQFVRKPKI